MRRELTDRDLAYEAIASEWAGFISDFDTRRRVETLVHRMLGRARVEGRRVLEVGCGLGYFTRELLKLGPGQVTAVDIAPSLVARLAAECPGARCLVGDIMALDSLVGEERFDVVLSSEVIEHTPDPRAAFQQLAGRVADAGVLAVSCPNQRWKWLLRAAMLAGLRRRYQGYENWVRPEQLVSWAAESGLEVVDRRGVHTLPWQFSHRLVEYLDRTLEPSNYAWSVNLAILATKP